MAGIQMSTEEMRNVIITGATSAAVFSRNGVMDISEPVITHSTIGLEVHIEDRVKEWITENRKAPAAAPRARTT
jgi:hypothetical protein